MKSHSPPPSIGPTINERAIILPQIYRDLYTSGTKGERVLSEFKRHPWYRFGLSGRSPGVEAPGILPAPSPVLGDVITTQFLKVAPKLAYLSRKIIGGFL